MAKRSTLSRTLARFWNNQSGNTAVMYALSVVPMLLAVGAGVDYARYSAAKTHLQAAVDGAAITAAALGSGKSAKQRVVAAEASLDTNLAAGAATGLALSTDFKVVNTTFRVTATAEVPSVLMQLAGISGLEARALAEVNIAQDKKAEIAMVLDYSGSMEDVSGGQVKYVAMRKAASKLVTDLAAANPENIKFGLVPFSHHVYTSLPGKFVLGGGASTWKGCTQDRPYPANTTNATPSSSASTKWNQPMAPDHAAWGCAGYATNNLVVKPLTDDFKSVTNQLSAMRPYAWTHIALGVEFGYHLLSNNAPFTEAASFADTKTNKFMIVLTDGMQTEPAFGPGGVRNTANGEGNLSKLCDAAKADGVTIVTVAFDLDDSGTRKRLQNCASGASNFFVADDATDLTLAFENVKTAIASNIYLSK